MIRRRILSSKKISINADKIDIQIIDLMLANVTNKEISSFLEISLSTVQRRIRNLLNSGLVTSKVQLNYEQLGYKTGLVHVYLRDGNINEIAKKVYELDGITSIEIHIGNSDILGNVINKEGTDLLNIFVAIKKMQGVERVVWSERIYQSPLKEYKELDNLKTEHALNL